MATSEDAAAARSAARRPFLCFVASFVLWVAGFYAAVFTLEVFPSVLEWTARRTGDLLRLLGEEATVTGKHLTTPSFGYTIGMGCDGVEPAIFYVAAVLAFPVPWGLRAIGVAAGLLAILAMNFLRLVGLYYAGVHFPDHFETMHVDVGQPGFVLFTLALWLSWCIWANRRPRSGT